MAFIIDTINGSGLYAQSAASASVATYDSNGNVITATYLTAHQPISANEWNSVYETVGTNSGSWTGSETSPTASVDSYGSIDIVSSNNTVYFDVNGTWFNNAVNSALPTSSVQWNSNYDTVNTNSGVWGGSALNISAGKGVKVTLINNNLVFSTDETVLWEGTYNGSVGSANAITMSEPLTNFSKIQFEMGGVYHSLWTYNSIATHYQVTSPFVAADGGTTLYAVMFTRLGDNKIYRNGCGILNNAALTNNAWVNNSTGTQGECTLVKIIGINRINNV